MKVPVRITRLVPDAFVRTSGFGLFWEYAIRRKSYRINFVPFWWKGTPVNSQSRISKIG